MKIIIDDLINVLEREIMTGIKTRITLYKNLNNFQHADKPKKDKRSKGDRKKGTLTLPDEENIAVDYEESEDAGTEGVIQKRPLESVKEPDEKMGDAEIDEFDPKLNKLTEADLRLPYGEVTLEEYLADANLDESMET